MYLARAPNGLPVALKELVFAVVPDAKVLEAFEREAQLLAQLEHPGIPAFHASFREGQGVHTRLYLAQEYVPGRNLLQVLAEHRFTEDEVLHVAQEVLGILKYLETVSPAVLHRDLKPANLIQRADGSLALVDFGSARDVIRGGTHSATMVGTFGYMPPEQLGGTLHPSADLYALGATLVHLLSRQSPDELLDAELELAFEAKVNVSAAMTSFLQRLVQRRVDRRFSSAREALEALPTSGTVEPSLDAPPSELALDRAEALFDELKRRDVRKANLASAGGIGAALAAGAVDGSFGNFAFAGEFVVLMLGLTSFTRWRSLRQAEPKWLLSAATAAAVPSAALKARLEAAGQLKKTR